MDNMDKDPWEYNDKDGEQQKGDAPVSPDTQNGAPTESNPPEPEDGGTPAPSDPQNGTPAGNCTPEDHSANPQDSGPHDSPYDNYGSQYQNPQNGSPYGNQYQNPQRGAPYGNPYGNPQNSAPYRNPQNGPYDNPYSPPEGGSYWNGGNYGQGPQQEPPRGMGTGLKVFLWILGIVAVGLVAAFVVFSVRPDMLKTDIDSSSSASARAPSSSSSPSSGGGFNGTLPKDPSSSNSGNVIGGVSGDGTNPNAAGISIQSKPSGAELAAKNIYKKLIQSVVGVETTVKSTTNGRTETGEGTGIVASSDGYILTNAHVVDYSRKNSVKVVMHDNKEYQATVVGYDKTSDLAVLKINATGLSPAEFGNVDQMEIGEQVLAIGNPGGLSFAGSLTGGMISALNRTIENHSDNGMTYIQTDAAINPGNSGGPLVNMYGQVIGINSNKIAATGYEGMGFAIPVSKAQTIINQLVRNGYVSGRCRLGITGQDIASEQAGIFGSPQGVIIRTIGSDSDMTRAGAQVGDVITAVGGKKITSLDDLSAALNAHKPGDTVPMTIYTGAVSGNGSYKTIKVKLLEDKGDTQK